MSADGNIHGGTADRGADASPQGAEDAQAAGDVKDAGDAQEDAEAADRAGMAAAAASSAASAGMPAAASGVASAGVLPNKAAEDDPRRWGDRPDSYDHDSWLQEQKPPHWG